jgi:hypothetical protein
MDLALPPGGLKRIFQQYDVIRSQGSQDPADPDPPPWQPEQETPASPAPEAPVQPKAAPPMAADSELKRLGYKQKNWGDVRADKEEKAQQLLAERLRESHANKLLEDKIKYPNGARYQQDEVGLEKAYNNKSYPGVYYDQSTRTMYVKGTSNAQDWWDDFSKIPVWGNLQDSFRYKDAERAYNDLLQRGMPVDRVVGHSLGGSVALQQQSDHDIPYSRTFGAPVFDLNPLHRGTVDRVRHPLDPVSVFDRGAKWGPLMAYPHTYTGFQSLDTLSSPVDHKALAMKARGYNMVV